jgi:hypothetical protein
MSQCTWYRCERLISHVFGLQEFRSRGRSCASSCTHQRQTTPCRSKRFGGALKTELSEINQSLLHQSWSLPNFSQKVWECALVQSNVFWYKDQSDQSDQSGQSDLLQRWQLDTLVTRFAQLCSARTLLSMRMGQEGHLWDAYYEKAASARHSMAPETFLCSAYVSASQSILSTAFMLSTKIWSFGLSDLFGKSTWSDRRDHEGHLSVVSANVQGQFCNGLVPGWATWPPASGSSSGGRTAVALGTRYKHTNTD